MAKTFITILSPEKDKFIEADSFFVFGVTKEEDGLHVEGSIGFFGDIATKGSFYYVLLSELAKLEDKYPELLNVKKAYEDGALPRYAEDKRTDWGCGDEN